MRNLLLSNHDRGTTVYVISEAQPLDAIIAQEFFGLPLAKLSNNERIEVQDIKDQLESDWEWRGEQCSVELREGSIGQLLP